MEENIYIYLKMSPKDGDEAVLKKLEDEINSWNKKRSTQPERANSKLAVLNAFKKELASNPNMLKEHADKSEELKKCQRIEQEKAIREDAKIYVVNGEIEESFLNDLAKRNSIYTKEEILKIIGARIKKKKVFVNSDPGQFMDRSLYDCICKDLSKVGKRSLYDFLSLPNNASEDEIKKTADKIFTDYVNKPDNDIKSAVNQCVGYCKAYLSDKAKRDDYNFTLANVAFDDVRKKIEYIAASSDKIIRPEQYKGLLEECTKKGMAYSKAEAMIHITAEQQKVTIVEASDSNSIKICRFCGSLNSGDAQVCKSCGLPVVVKCPKCGRESSEHDELRCVKCGFVIGDLPLADSLLKDAQTALKYNNVEEAIKCLESAAGIWPAHPKLQEVANVIKKIQSSINGVLSEVSKLCAKHAYYQASTFLSQMGYGKDATAFRKEIESAVSNADALIAKAKSSNDVNEQLDCYMQALSFCSDCSIAKEKLKLTPPVAPTQIKAEANGKVIHVEWIKQKSQYIQYLVIRKAESRPNGPNDGEVICETLNNAIDDNKTKPGFSYYYAVYSKCGDIISPQAAIISSPVMTVEDIDPNTIKLDVQETQIGFNIEFPNKVKSIEIYRDGTLVKNMTGTSYLDMNLKPEHPYTYKFVAVYEDCAQKKHCSAGIIQVITPMSPPKPVNIVMTEKDDIVSLTWGKPNKGTLYIYESDRAFDILENNKVNVDNIKYHKLDISGTSYQLRKNFSGVKYFLPVTVQGNIGVAGKYVKLISIIKPTGVGLDRNDTFVMLRWRWDNISSVRIQVQVDGGNAQKYDVNSIVAPNYRIDLPKNAKIVKIGIASIINVGNEILVGEEISHVLSLKSVKVNFKEVKSESFLGFMNKDKYSMSLICESSLPSKLELLISENFSPTNLVNYKSYLTICPEEIKPGVVLKKEFSYTRMQKGKPVYFRLISADRELAKQIEIIPETRQLK
ncbi:MAG: zinc ribbon domain-containing protein [Bacteroidales bacterium]|nr:zinc ribbon domain-containing protein [Bacteroidales bacterium]